MPNRAARRCTAAGCPSDAAFGGRCAKHRHPARKPKASAPRPSSHAQGYTRKWRELSERIRAQRPWCEVPSCGAPSEHVDHIDGDKTNWAESNLAALCHSHHSQKTAKHDGGFGNPRTPRP
ncbi:hypothetical protein Aple_010610 [Acrocarpospora pleiomorpha]|uniref:HNH nuclease domain-containing protein n=1 Tax=Acrocarpospora pleiomorpha TaxID=90975 RepID=A0A5M3XBX5_9ACTN|nr:hypothetical protein Aple_010610 [Acrocarpospora pleiomorpha]